MWYNFRARAKLSDEAFVEMMDEEIRQGKDPLSLIANARMNGWQHISDDRNDLHLDKTNNIK